MAILNFHCKLCGVTSKVLWEDVTLTPDNTLVEGLCGPCFGDYQKQGIVDLGPVVAMPDDVRDSIEQAALRLAHRKK